MRVGRRTLLMAAGAGLLAGKAKAQGESPYLTSENVFPLDALHNHSSCTECTLSVFCLSTF